MRNAAIFLLSGLIVFAQERPSFEVATIKPSAAGDPAIKFDVSSEGRVVARNYTVFNLIRAAFGFDLQESQILGGPGWFKERGFDIQAQPSQPTSKVDASRMLQTLLEDRFQLKWHWEMPERSVFALTLGPGGSKLAPSREGGQRVGFGDLDFPSMDLDMLRQIVEGEVGRPVLNRTGLTGAFAVKLKWASDRSPNPDRTLPALATALQEQLGLKLELVKAPVKTFVIDRLEMPSEN